MKVSQRIGAALVAAWLALASLPVAAALVSGQFGAQVAGWQRVVDPLMPLLLALALLLAVGVTVTARRRAPAEALSGSIIGWPRALGLGMVALLFIVLAAAVNGRDTSARLLEWDAAVSTAATRWVGPAAQQALRWVSDLGDLVVLTPLVIVAWAWLLSRRQRALAWGVLLAVLVNSLAVRVLKQVFDRARPPGADVLVTSGASFPSGHAAGALMVYGILMWLLLPLVERRRWRTLLAVAGGGLIGAIVASRVLLRVHFVSDVMGGLLLSSFTLLLATALLRPWRKS